MIPLIVLYFIPIGLIAIVIIAIIRLIIRASSGSSSNTTNTSYNQYRQPPPQTPYNQQNPPYNQQNQTPYEQQNPYIQNPADPTNPPPPPSPSWQNPGTYQQPDYTQQNYGQPNYTQPNYQQPNYTPPTYHEPGVTPPGGAKRSTNIHGNYATHVGAAVEKKRNPAVMIILIVVGVIVLLGGGIAYVAYQRSEGPASLVSESFYLAYENPTENTYYIVLDEVDTIKVDPFTSSEDLDYRHRRDLTTFHWQILDADYKMIADTSVSEDDVNTWMYDRTKDYYAASTILFNPSRTEYVYYTRWFDDIGYEYMDDVKVGDSVYFADAYTVSSAFIFDGRDPQYSVNLEDASEYSTLEQNQYLLSRYDFEVFYAKNNGEVSQASKMEDYRDQLVLLFETAKEEVLINNAYDVDDVNTCYALDSLTPSYVDDDTEPRDFIPAIDFVKENASLFRATARVHYNYIVDSADVILKHSYVPIERSHEYVKMVRKSYMVTKEGFFADKLSRESYYDEERNTMDATYY
jgi:flagellar basal body-associated protein FliL